MSPFPVVPELFEGPFFFLSTSEIKELPFDKLRSDGGVFGKLLMPAPEHQLRIAPADAPRATIVIVPPLFEEANRTRRTLVLAMRALAADGFAAVLPDLPGPNESLRPIGRAA